VDRRTLVFEQEAGQIETAVVRFRCDGAIGPAALARAPLAQRSEQFLAKWNERSDALALLLDPDFVFAPGGMRRDFVLRNQPQVQFKVGEGSVVDVARIGGVETVELRADWQMRDRQRQPFVVPQWPMLLQWRDVGQGPRLVRLQPVTAVDSGRYDGRGGYAHDALRIRIGAVPNAVLSRTQDELTGLQVRIVHSSGLAVQITGLLADVADTNAAIQFRLSGGASILRSGQRLDADGGDALQEWRFDDATGPVRERWEYLQRGRRHVLVRCMAVGADLRAAEAAIGSDSAMAWFAQVRAALQID
jgi:sarcosine oxidase delta subunit